MSPETPSLPHVLNMDTYLPPNNPYNIILSPSPPLGKKLKEILCEYMYTVRHLMFCQIPAGTKAGPQSQPKSDCVLRTKFLMESLK